MRKTTAALLCATMLLSSCIKKDFLNAEHQDGNNQKPMEEYFDFKTTAEVHLEIDYGFENYSIPFELYLQNPYDEEGNKLETFSPFFGAFTDGNSKFSGKVKIPAYIETVYICSDYVGIPTVLELSVSDNQISYIYESEPASRSLNYEGDCISIGNSKMSVEASKGLYAIYNSYNYRTGSSNNYKYYTPSNTANNRVFTEVSNKTQLTPQSTLGQLLSRISSTLTKKDNTFYCSDSRTTNLRIAKKTEDGNDIESAHIDLIFIQATGSYHNAMGYYYYKSDANLTPAEIKALPKYMVFPRTTTNKPGHRIKARLQYFGENYSEAGVDHFPPGYTIGWILVPNIGAEVHSFVDSSNLTTINRAIGSAYSKRAVYSNQECNNNNNNGYGCVTVWDELSQKIVIGFEDTAYEGDCGDKSYQDILFYVDCDPIEAIYDPNRPEIEEDPQGEVLRTITQTSTLAYEDVWPSGGDYDMNDVVIESVQSLTYNDKNKIKRIENRFKAVHSGATLKNGFGLIFNGSVSQIDEEESNYSVKEENNQYMIIENVKAAIGAEYSIVRTFGEQGIDMAGYNAEINPFIVPSYIPGEKNRTEVHLPKSDPSPWADTSLLGTGNDAYYLDVNGKYPFAIELVDVTAWQVVTETKKIGSEGEYPGFNSWVESNGVSNRDWYLHKY